MKIPKFLKRFWPRAEKPPAPEVRPETLEEFLERIGPPPECLTKKYVPQYVGNFKTSIHIAPSVYEFKATEYGAAMLAKFRELFPDPPPPTAEELKRYADFTTLFGDVYSATLNQAKSDAESSLKRSKADMGAKIEALRKNEKWLIGELETARLRMADLQEPPASAASPVFTKRYFTPGHLASTLKVEDLGAHDSGWTISGEIVEDWCKWVNAFEATHPELGWVKGDFEKEVTASSERAFEHFFSHHPPENWDYHGI